MKYAGIDLHKQTITVCVVDHSRTVLDRRRLYCVDESSIVRYFESLGPYHAVVEATASYEWLVRLIEPSAGKVLLAHPRKLRVTPCRARMTKPRFDHRQGEWGIPRTYVYWRRPQPGRSRIDG